MAVHAVTPRIVALSGHVQIHSTSCAGDCCNYDRFTDDLVTGEDIYDGGEWPDKPLNLVPGELRTAGVRVESHSRVHASRPTRTGRDGRGAAPSPSHTSGASLPPASPAHGVDIHAPGSPGRTPPSALSSRSAATVTSSDTQTRPGGHPSGS